MSVAVSHLKAQELLWKCLSREQDEELASKGYFTVKGSEGGIYRIVTEGIVNNVIQISPETNQWCIYLPDVPHPDTWLAQKLLIETDEKSFRSIAIPSYRGRLGFFSGGVLWNSTGYTEPVVFTQNGSVPFRLVPEIIGEMYRDVRPVRP